MAYAEFARRLPPPTAELPPAVGASLPAIDTGVAMRTAPAPAEPPVISTVHHAVEAVWRAVELFPAAHHPGLKLQFSVGGDDLVVRLDWRRDEVRAVFQTDSAELRTALAAQWQAVIPAAGDRPVRLADPQFCGLEDFGRGDARDGDSAPRDHQSPGERFPTAEETFGAIRGRMPAAPAPVAVVRPSAGITSRLQTLA